MTAQLDLALPRPKRTQADFTALARAELTEALGLARAATAAPPWDLRQQKFWRIVFPQMAGWLPPEERQLLVAEFLRELDRIEPMFGTPS
jgi:hypothetical protein